MWETAELLLDSSGTVCKVIRPGPEVKAFALRPTLRDLQGLVVLGTGRSVRQNGVGYIECFCVVIRAFLLYLVLLVRVVHQDQSPVALPDFVLACIFGYLERLIMRPRRAIALQFAMLWKG